MSDRGADAGANRGRFKPGQSGNPRGRPKKSRDQDPLSAALNEKVTINLNGRKRRVTKKHASAMQIANASASGDFRSAKFSLDYLAKVESRNSGGDAPPDQLSESDSEIFANVLTRLKRIVAETEEGQ